MPRIIIPRAIAPPASRYAHGIVHSARARRLVISGQVGVMLDGTIAKGLKAQLEACWDNLDAILAEAGMARTDLIRLNVYCTVPGSVAICRGVRDRRLDGHLVATTYLEVAGLARPELLVEIEAEAVSEESDFAFLDYDDAETGLAAGRGTGSSRAKTGKDGG
jgi:enamine deaminase RidA (YjgF/YER057c/UK114 family)